MRTGGGTVIFGLLSKIPLELCNDPMSDPVTDEAAFNADPLQELQ